MTKKTTKKAVKKVPAKKAVKKATKKVAKKATKKVAAKATKTVTKKATKKATKSVATKPRAKKKIATKTTIAARVDVGFGNNLYIRGEGAGLSWDVGILMRNLSPYEWAWETKSNDKPIEYKLLINDEIWANGENQFAQSDETSITAPTFNWL
jgi:hypothetical protein